MAVRRVRSYPYPPPMKSVEDANRYLRSFVTATQEEAVQRIEDFSILNLSHVPWIDVREKGAVCDGVHDDAVGLTAAISSLGTSGGVVLIPDNMLIASSIALPVLTSEKAILFKGTKPHTKIKFTATDSNLFNIVATGAYKYWISYQFENLLLEGPDGLVSGDGIHIEGGGQFITLSMRNCIVHNFAGGNGIYGKAIYGCSLENVIANYCSTNIRLLDDANTNHFYNVQIFEGREYGLYLSNIISFSSHGLWVENNQKTGLYLTGVSDAVFTQTHFENNNHTETASKYALHLEATADKPNKFITFINARFTDLPTINGQVYIDGTASYNALIEFLNGSHYGNDGNQIVINGANNFGIKFSGEFAPSRIYNPNNCEIFQQYFGGGVVGQQDFPRFLGNKRWTYGAAAPTSGTWQVGDICWHTDAASGEPLGWYCTVAGTPGTWNAFGTLA